jgi:hypothetical protein
MLSIMRQGAFLQSVLAARGVGTQQVSQLDASDFRGGESLAGDAVPSNRTQDAAAGPAWSEQLLHGFKGAVPADRQPACWHVHTHVGCEVKSISAGHLADQSTSAPCEARVQLTTGQVISVDVVVTATGVAPNVGWCVPHGQMRRVELLTSVLLHTGPLTIGVELMTAVCVLTPTCKSLALALASSLPATLRLRTIGSLCTGTKCGYGRRPG